MRKHMLYFSGCLYLLLTSCGSGRELQNSQAKTDSLSAVVNDLKGQVGHLTTHLNTLNSSTAGNASLIAQLQTQNTVALQEAADCKHAKEAVAARMEELNQAMMANGISMKEVRKKAEDALIQFANAGVEVRYKNGLVYISMQDELLFAAGSAKLGKNGQEALSVVARVLNDNPNLKIYVIGNTDSIKVTRGFTDNWSLSTERANSVVRVLRDQYQVSMDRVTSAGRARYAPVADNAAPEGRARNRRTDIVLNPDLSRLWDLIDKQQ